MNNKKLILKLMKLLKLKLVFINRFKKERKLIVIVYIILKKWVQNRKFNPSLNHKFHGKNPNKAKLFYP